MQRYVALLHWISDHDAAGGEPVTARGVTGRRDQLLDVTCWCEAYTVAVTAADVINGRTGSCKLGCGPDSQPGTPVGRGRPKKGS